MAQRPPELPGEFNEQQAGQRPARSGNRYLAAWATMAFFSAAYLAAVAIRPAFLDGYLPAATAASADETSQMAADIVNIRDSISQLQTDVAQTQTDVAEQAEKSRSFNERLLTLENHPSNARDTDAIAPAPAAASDFPTGVQPPPGKQAAASSSDNKPKVLNALETGSVEPAAKPKAPKPVKKAAAPPPPKPKPKQIARAEPISEFSVKVDKPVAVRLATGATVDNLRLSWEILSARHRQELGPLQPRYYNKADGNGIKYELVAGPFRSTEDAKRVCASLKAQAIDCQLSSFGGNAL